MADETTTNVADTSQTDSAESEDKSPAQTESEFMDETIKGIKETQKAIHEQEIVGDEDGHSDSNSNDSDIGGDIDTSGRLEELAGTEVPEAFSQIAEQLGMTPAEIVAIADKHTDEQLLEMVPFLQESLSIDTDEDDEPEAGKDASNKGDTKDTKADEDTQAIIDQITAKVKDELGVSLDDINKFKEQQAAQQVQQNFETANRKFDEAAKDFPIFGKTEELPRFTSGRLKGQFIPTSPTIKARLEVAKYADAFVSAGHSVEDAMDLALNTYGGKNLRTEMERKLIKDLKQHERNLSGGRVGKEVKRTNVDSRDEIIDEIRQMQRQAGIDV